MINAPSSHRDKNSGTSPLQYLKIIDGVLKRPVPIILLVMSEMHESVPNLEYLRLSFEGSFVNDEDPIEMVGIKVGMTTRSKCQILLFGTGLISHVQSRLWLTVKDCVRV